MLCVSYHYSATFLYNIITTTLYCLSLVTLSYFYYFLLEVQIITTIAAKFSLINKLEIKSFHAWWATTCNITVTLLCFISILSGYKLMLETSHKSEIASVKMDSPLDHDLVLEYLISTEWMAVLEIFATFSVIHTYSGSTATRNILQFCSNWNHDVITVF